MVHRTPWPYKVDTYDLFQLIRNNPRIGKKEISRIFKVNEKTGLNWWEQIVARGILRIPILRKNAFTNFREYFYFLNVEDPHELYLELRDRTDLAFYSVQSGFSNFQIVSRKRLNLKDAVVSGERSDYYVTNPPHCTFDDAVQMMLRKVKRENFPTSPTPLIYHKEKFQKWDKNDEKIYRYLCNDFRKSYRKIKKDTGTYTDKILYFLRHVDEFGQVIVMYFPDGLGAYQPTTFLVETDYDSVLIDIFSCLPVSTAFYRIKKYLLMKVYLPFMLEGEMPYRSVPYVILNELRKKKLVYKYTNSIDQYHYRPQF